MALMTARWIHATPSRKVKSRPQTECPASGTEKAGGQRPGRAQGTKTAEGSTHAEGQAAGPEEPRRDPEGEGNQGQTRGNRTGRQQARNRPQARNIPSISLSGTRRIFTKAPSVRGPPGQARGVCFSSRSPANPGVDVHPS